MAAALILRFRKKFPKGAPIDAELQVRLDPPSVTCLVHRALAGPRSCGHSLDSNAPQTVSLTLAPRFG
jgi:hypothetical protein